MLGEPILFGVSSIGLVYYGGKDNENGFRLEFVFNISYENSTLTIDLVLSGRLAMGGGMGAGATSVLSSSLADICADDGVWKLCCVNDSLMCIICAPVCDSESVGVLLGLLLLKWLSDEPVAENGNGKSASIESLEKGVPG